jgi:uncharacterized peroxidase-related enzyme
VRHHGESLRALTRNDELLAALERNPASAPLVPRQRALVDYALKLTRAPRSLTESDIATLRGAGLSDAAIHDAVAITAYFNFVNRMASGLNVELEAEYQRRDSSQESG